MPNRIIRDWTDSYAVNNLDAKAERFFIRLMMKADDFGLYTADERLLRASLFPLLLDEVRDSDITRWIAACVNSGLIRLYTVSGKKYLEIKNFGQRLDKARPKHPLPPKEEPDDDHPTIGNDFPEPGNDFPESSTEFPAETETETERETEYSLAQNARSERFPFQDFWDQFGKKVDRTKCERKWNRLKDTERESAMCALPEYVASTPDVRFRKNPLTWLNGQCWQDEIIQQKPIQNATAKRPESIFSPNVDTRAILNRPGN